MLDGISIHISNCWIDNNSSNKKKKKNGNFGKNDPKYTISSTNIYILTRVAPNHDNPSPTFIYTRAPITHNHITITIYSSTVRHIYNCSPEWPFILLLFCRRPGVRIARGLRGRTSAAQHCLEPNGRGVRAPASPVSGLVVARPRRLQRHYQRLRPRRKYLSLSLLYLHIYIRRGTVSFRQILFFFFSVFANRPNCWLDMWTFYCKRKNTAGREKYRYIKRHTCVCARGERSRVDASRTFWRSMVSRESCVMTGVRLCFFLTLRLVVVEGCRRPYIESRSYRHFIIFHFFLFF